jgi:hypothetical protein
VYRESLQYADVLNRGTPMLHGPPQDGVVTSALSAGNTSLVYRSRHGEGPEVATVVIGERTLDVSSSGYTVVSDRPAGV